MSAPGSGPHTLGPHPRPPLPGDLQGPPLCLHKGLGTQDAWVKPDEGGQSAGGRSRNKLRLEDPGYIVLPKRQEEWQGVAGWPGRRERGPGFIPLPSLAGLVAVPWRSGASGCWDWKAVARIGVHRLGQEPQMT